MGSKPYIAIVGGAGGIGQAIVSRYLNIGASVLVIDKNDPPEGQISLVNSIIADVTNIDDIRLAARKLDDAGIVIDHLVSLAGGASNEEWTNGLREINDESIEASIRLNLTSHLWLVKYLMEDRKRCLRDRSVVFVSSINALRGFGLTSYSAAKAGLLGATRELACSLGRRGIRVNALLPGTVPTPRTLAEPKDFTKLLKTTALGHFAKPEDIAAGCYFLTHMTNAITGQALVIDAGQSVHPPGC